MAENKDLKSPGTGTQGEGDGGYEMNRKFGIITILLSATGMAMVPLLSRMATRVDMFDGSKGLNAGDSVGAFMASGRMFFGLLFFLALVLATRKWGMFRRMKLTPAIALGGLCIGLSLSCYVTATLMTSVANCVLFIYTGPVICVLLARIFRKEPMTVLNWVCLAAVFIGMLFAESLIGFQADGKFAVSLSIETSTPDFPQKGVGDIFGLLSGLFYGLSMFFNGYRKDADSACRGIWNFVFATIGAGALTLVMNFMGTSGMAASNWALDLHLSTFNWVAAVGFWIVCGPFALGLLLYAGRNLPAADYGTIAYWEVPVALFIGLVIFGEAFTVNTILGSILIVGGGAIPAIRGMILGSRQQKEAHIRGDLAEKLEAEQRKEEVN